MGDEDTMITTRDGQKHIAEVKKKDLVLGIDNRYSAVTENVFVEGPAEMVRLQFVEHEADLTAGAGILACVARFTEICPLLSAMCTTTFLPASPLAVATCIALL